MRFSLRVKLIISFSVVVLITGIFATWVGVHLIGDMIINQIQDKVRIDLNSAREIYTEKSENIMNTVRFTAVRFFLKECILNNNIDQFKSELENIRKRESFDILNITDKNGVVIYRTRNPRIVGDRQAKDPLIALAMLKKEAVVSTEIVIEVELLKEGEDFLERAHIEVIPTQRARTKIQSEKINGMMIKAAAPILDNDGNLIGVLYGGLLLNQNYEIVDKIKDIVYQDEIYKGKKIGAATIFQGDLRISTFVEREDGQRAIGTRVSEKVYDQVFEKGVPWLQRAFIINDWYITAYEPIKNISGNIIGILAVGMLEQKFSDMRKSTMWIFLGIALTGVMMALIVSYFIAKGVLRPIKHLVFASEQLAQGDLTYKVNLKSKDEIGQLGDTFNFMADSLHERDEKLKQRAQETIQESERLATIGQLAAGVAHELNNPLGGVLIYSHLLLENLPDDDPKRENLEKIVTQTTRCKTIVKGLLDFARQTEPKSEPTDINDLIKSTLSLLENQALFQNIKIIEDFKSPLPNVMADRAQIQQVFINIILNAAEAMDGEGDLSIQTKISHVNSFIEVEFMDTGCGISKENLERLFEPFFTTKEIGHGTGLGLAISYGIIQKHNGIIDVQSKMKKGTTFTIRLPIAEETN